MTSICTRIATLADLDEVARLFDLYRQFYEQSPDLQRARDFIRQRMQFGESVILLATRESGECVGFCQLYPIFCSIEAKPIYSFSDLYVTQEARRSGVGRMLLLAAQTYSSEHGRSKMDLTTAKTNKVAQVAYESLGWVRDDVYYAYSKRTDG